jgi:alkylation response protein AidB-like acyl-CoA dehydrogenase
MAVKTVSERNIRFLLYDVFDVEAFTKYDYYSEHNRKMFDMVLKAALKLAKDMLAPHFEEMDRKAPELVDGVVKVHPMVKTMMKEFGEGGWISSRAPFERDGEQLPYMIADICHFIFAAANYSSSAFPGLTFSASNLIESFGSEQLFQDFVPKMRAGLWQGTMALTEPEAGSSLTDITSMANPTDNGYYQMTGQKIFISAGDHDGVENVVHLLLAKTPGAPAGVKGISLFVVPKMRVAQNGQLESNDVNVSGVYHKLGYRGCPIVSLSLGDKKDCRGWLVGDLYNGLKYMFQMMNEKRIGVGLAATAIATAAYYAALDFAKTRRQGRSPSQKDPTKPPIAIIEHADVKRMLLFQKAIVEGSQSLLVQCSKYVDYQKAMGPKDAEEKQKYFLLLDLLTPIAKSYPSEMCIVAISQGLQILGGSGYCDDYTLEQHYRDCRIHPIHEGTTGIQGMDLLGRKVGMNDGKAYKLYLDEVRQTIKTACGYEALEKSADELDCALKDLDEVTKYLLSLNQKQGREVFLADATLYLEFFGIVTIAWQWLLQGVVVQKALAAGVKKTDTNFYQGKMYALQYFFGYELPKILGLKKRLYDIDQMTVKMPVEYFND